MSEQYRVCIVDDDLATRRLMELTIGRAWGHEVRVFESGIRFLEAFPDDPGIVLLDIMMSGMTGVDVLRHIKERSPSTPVIMLSAQGNINVAVETMKLGAEDYFTKPVDFNRLRFALEKAVRLQQLEHRVRQLQEAVEGEASFEGIIGADGAMRNVLRLADKARHSDITVLIEGESGTGKELIARAIHFNGKRREQPFVVLNCAAIPRDLLESELFGHERGAFTGAVDRKPGKFELAHQGTIFLDEIGEMDLALQAKLLRVLQQQEFERVGGTETVRVNVRVISATNRELARMVADGLFREDLYYRLCTFPVKLPPLRERPADILLLAEHFLGVFARKEGRDGLLFSRLAVERMTSYHWPGNIRELQARIERAVLLSEGQEIPESLFPIPTTLPPPHPPEVMPPIETVPDGSAPIIPLEELKKQALLNALHTTGWNIKEAATLLGIGRTTAYRMMDEYGIHAKET
ncbi:MAG: sigma-54 dependent transcriptional regulator [Bacteroidia bacterium]|nr:sigma-54 dependent transcriptional regulator [Bacteroidia bacterium]